jgi:hypothetical protein
VSNAEGSHVIAVRKLDNEELTEDVLARQEAEGQGAAPGEPEPGPRVVTTAPLPETTRRSHPAEALPGTLSLDQRDD